MNALHCQRTLDPRQQDFLVHGWRVDEHGHVQRHHLQELKALHVRLKVLEHLRVRQTRDRLQPSRPAKHAAVAGTAHQMRVYVSRVSAQSHVVLQEQDGMRPAQCVLDDQRPVGVHVFVADVRRKRRQVERYYHATRVVAVAGQLAGVVRRQAQVVDEHGVVGQLLGDVLAEQDGGRGVSVPHVRDNGEVVSRPIVYGMREAEQV